MENEPKEPKLHKFSIEFPDGTKLECSPSTTMGFLHPMEPYGDHIFIFNSDNPEEDPSGSPIFRSQLNDFDSVIKMMKRHGYTVIESETGYMTDGDRTMYNEFIMQNPSYAHQPQPYKAGELDWTSPRRDKEIHNAVEFMIWLAMHDRLE